MEKQRSYIVNFIRENRLKLGLTQEDIAAKAGVGLRFIRELEQGKETVQLAKVNQVLALFRAQLIPGVELDGFSIQKEHFKRPVEISLKTGRVLQGQLTGFTYRDNKIYSWDFEEELRTLPPDTDKEKYTIIHQDIAGIKNI